MKITWKPAQRLELAKRSHQLISDPLFTGNKLDAVRQAQAELFSAQDQRELKTFANVKPWIEPLWTELSNQIKNGPAIQPVIDYAAEAHYQQKQLALSELSTEDLLGEFMRRVADMTSERRIRNICQEQVQIELERSIPGWKPTTYIEEPEVIKAADKPHVLIVGLQGDQIQILENKYRGKLDLHFKSGAEGARHIKSLVDNMHFTIKTKWCKQGLGSTSTWPNFQNCNGGMSEIQRLLNMRFRIEAHQSGAN
jgi:hypothetical protein